MLSNVLPTMPGTRDEAAVTHIKRLTQLKTDRTAFENVWRQVSAVARPLDAGNFNYGSLASNIKGYVANAATASIKIYDTTAVTSIDRLGAGLEAIVFPQSEKWHALEIDDIESEEHTHEESLWLEKLRNLMFRIRYDSTAGWVTAMQTCLREMIAYGNSFMIIEDGVGYSSKDRVLYTHIPLNECYIAIDKRGNVDTFYRYYQLTARQAVQKFGHRCAEQVKIAATQAENMDRSFTFIQCIFPRSDYGLGGRIGMLGAAYASLHIDETHTKVVGEGGFRSFPIIDFRWLPSQNKPYAEGPVMQALADIQSLNLMAKNEMHASNQAGNPPLLVANAGVMNRPNANPGAITMGGVNAQGQRLVEPLFNQQRQDFQTMVLEAKRKQVKSSLYIDLFSILIQNPQMSATEALLKANEKGELLGPAGSRIEHAGARVIERELDVLERRNIFGAKSAYRRPKSLASKNVTPQFTGPLSRLRRTKEAEATVRVLQIMSPLAQIDPEVADNFEGDEMTRGLSDIFGMPKKFISSPEKVAAKRANRQAQAQQQQQMALLQQAADIGNVGGKALTSIQGGI